MLIPKCINNVSKSGSEPKQIQTFSWEFILSLCYSTEKNVGDLGLYMIFELECVRVHYFSWFTQLYGCTLSGQVTFQNLQKTYCSPENI